MDALAHEIELIAARTKWDVHYDRERTSIKIYTKLPTERLLFTIYQNMTNSSTYYLLDTSGTFQATPLASYQILSFFDSLN